MKRTTITKTSRTLLSPFRCSLLLILPLVICLELLPRAQAVSPPPDGGYGGANTAEGTDALFSLTSGVWNAAVGFQSLYNDTSGNQNTATGYKALFSNTTGDKSTAFGSQALYSNTTGSDNVASGFGSLYTNTTGNRNTGVGYRTLAFNNGDDNTAIGWNALYNNGTGLQNTAIGSGALLHGSGSENTATGFQALNNNTTGFDNTATGSRALFQNGNGEGNTATGERALYNNNAGSENAAYGTNALWSNTAGENNTAIGGSALFYNSTGGVNTAVGVLALQNNRGGSFNVAVGADAGFLDGDNNIWIGSAGPPSGSNMIHIGQQFFYHNLYGFDHDPHTATFIAGISGTTVTGTPVVITADGQLGVSSSSERFKQDITPMDDASHPIFALKPVTFRYKEAIDAKRLPQFGLIAEEVAKVNPDLVVLGCDGKPFTVRYDAVNAMLLNEFLKEHQKVEDLEATVAQLAKHIKEQDSKIEKITNERELSKAAPQVVANR